MTDEQVRNQVFLLLSTINACQKELTSNIRFISSDVFETDFPFFSYLYVLYDYMARGYFRETESYYSQGTSGKINWKKTIKNIQPIVQDGKIIYTDYYRKRSRVKEDELFHLVQQYCIYLSSEKVGWLFSNKQFERPYIRFDQSLFSSVVTDKLAQTFNDKNKQLFIHMLNIINCLERSNNKDTKRYGTNRFEYVWEAMIDRVFGIDGKEKYYPISYWYINENSFPSTELRPDTIMALESAVLVLDAKYYRYGIDPNPDYLPNTSSTHKQITYGEYISDKSKFGKDFGDSYTVYNAFLLPFDTLEGPFARLSEGQPYYRFGESLSSWKGNDQPYERVQGILVDVKHLLNLNLTMSQKEMEALSQLIIENV